MNFYFPSSTGMTIRTHTVLTVYGPHFLFLLYISSLSHPSTVMNFESITLPIVVIFFIILYLQQVIANLRYFSWIMKKSIVLIWLCLFLALYILIFCISRSFTSFGHFEPFSFHFCKNKDEALEISFFGSNNHTNKELYNVVDGLILNFVMLMFVFTFYTAFEHTFSPFYGLTQLLCL